MKLRGPIARILDFKADEPKGPALISKPFDVTPSIPAALGGLSSLKRPDVMAKYQFFDVPFVHQQHINLCGDASASMLLGFFGLKQPDLTKNPRGVLEGLQTPELQALLKRGGLNAVRVMWPLSAEPGARPAWSAANLAARLRKHGPIICSGRLPNDVVDHYVVLVGASEDGVVVHDPWSGPRQLHSLQQFNEFLDWTDNDSMMAGSQALDMQSLRPPAQGLISA